MIIAAMPAFDFRDAAHALSSSPACHAFHARFLSSRLFSLFIPYCFACPPLLLKPMLFFFFFRHADHFVFELLRSYYFYHIDRTHFILRHIIIFTSYIFPRSSPFSIVFLCSVFVFIFAIFAAPTIFA